MKRLLICSRSHVPHGGADRIIVDLCRHLPSRGWEVRLALTQGASYNDVAHYMEVLGQDLPVVPVDGRLGTRHARVAGLRRVIRAEKPDVVLSMRVYDAYAATRAEKAADPSAPRLAVGLRSFEAPYLVDLERHADGVDLCVTSGQLLADLAVSACGLPADRVVSIGGGVHPPSPAAVPRPRAARPRLLYAGRLEDGQKRLADLPPLLDRLDAFDVAFTLDIAGTGPAEGALRERLARRIATGQVRFLGWLDRVRLYEDVYPSADIFVHLAGWEGMTIAPREAMAHGVVPVISAFKGLKREGQFRDGHNSLVFPVGDVAAAAEAIRRLASEDGLITRLSAAAIRSQSGHYSFQGALDAWAVALDRCLSQERRMGEPVVDQDRRVGRLSRIGLPESVESWLRSVLGRPVRHQSPGSEWPTSSGGLSAAQCARLEREAQRLDVETHQSPAFAEQWNG